MKKSKDSGKTKKLEIELVKIKNVDKPDKLKDVLKELDKIPTIE